MTITVTFNNIFGLDFTPPDSDLNESDGVNMASDSYMQSLMDGLNDWSAPVVHTSTRFETGATESGPSLLKFTGSFQYSAGSTIPLSSSTITSVIDYPGFGAYMYSITGLPNVTFNYNTFDVWTAFKSVMNQGFIANGSPARDTLVGGNGHDTLRGFGGDDTLSGGAGNDKLYGGDTGEGFPVNLYSDVLDGGDGDDQLFGGNNDAIDKLFGGNGNDRLDAGSGTSSGEYMAGGPGNDTFIAHTTGGHFIFENPNEGYDTIIWKGYWGQVDGSSVPGIWSYYSISANVERLIVDSAAGEQVLPGNAVNSIKEIIGGPGNDNLMGGSTGTAISGGGGNDDLFAYSIGTGADTLNGGPGADRMAGKEGNDTYVVDNPGDLVNDSGGIDTVRSYITFTLPQAAVQPLAAANAWLLSVTTHGGEFENLVLIGTAPINGTGNGLDNVLTGNGAKNTLYGLGGNDTLQGGSGNDLLIGGGGNDRLDGGPGDDQLKGGPGDDVYVVKTAGDIPVELADQGIDLVETTRTYTLPNHIENLLLTGTAALNGTGNGLGNVLTGNSAVNILNGMGGDDTLNGGDGADTLQGGGGNDQLFGGAGNDQLLGGAGNDTLGGGPGFDTMRGGIGDDTYTADAPGEPAIELAGEGIDTIRSGLSWTLQAEFENLTLLGSTAINGTGNVLNNLLIGNSAANALTGLNGDDRLDGRGGNDTLKGGSGRDDFIFGSELNGTTNVDTILDFKPAAGDPLGFDQIVLDDDIFSMLTGGDPGTALAEANFAANADGVAMEVDDFIVYDTDSGALYYDADGSGSGTAVQFAVLTGAPALAAEDVLVVS